MSETSLNAQSAFESFAAGDYARALELSLDRQKSEQGAGIGTLYGSLCFLGRVAEAEILYQKEQKHLTRGQKIEARFFLGLGMTRDSRYKLGVDYFSANLKELSSDLSPEERFYIFQGISFYRYFSGKFKSALKDAQRAFQEALKSDLLYGRVLSADLKGHLQVQMGEIHAGLKTLKEAKRLAAILGNRAMVTAVDISIVVYESEYGLNPQSVIAILLKVLQTHVIIQDTYSRSGLLLELARQYILRGDFSKAEETLDQASELIYVSQNRRQEVTLHLRYAYLNHLRGEDARGLSFVRSSKRGLVPEVDRVLKLSVLGIEHLLVKTLKMKDAWETTELELERSTAHSGGAISRRILLRSSPGFSDELESRPSGDMIGNLKDLLVRNPSSAASEIIRNGYLSFLYSVLPVSRGAQIIYLDLQEGSLTVFDRNKMEHGLGLTALTRSFLVRLASDRMRPKTKEELIRKVWKYTSYHPLRHDPLIYQAVMAVRRLLGRHSNWIITTEQGYSLQPGVAFKVAKLTKEDKELNTQVFEDNLEYSKKRLNYRQIKILRKLKQNEFINVHDYKEMFGVSEITATRDLSGLNQQGLMVRVGLARATRYTLPSKGKSL